MRRKKRHPRQNGESGDDQELARPSRSAQKRRSLALQDIGARLTGVAPDNLAGFGLPLALRDAVLQYSSLRGHEARRRQMQYIGRLMRELDDVSLAKLITAGLAGKSESMALPAAPLSRSDT
ncbi:MAG: DUF615 domain-containing protein [Desulfovibrio sp.]|jgi:ribosome-associated protein|nr:DUF615 domain-containing protein [Desulfovibrio sp.]